MMYRKNATEVVQVPPLTGDHEATSEARASRTRSDGWDPFEVWRDRIQRPRQQSGKASLSEFERARQKS
jgi:hypothetical protein